MSDDAVIGRLEQWCERYGGPAFSEKELEDLFKVGEARYACHVPPGFFDIDKNGDERRKYGDLVLWAQLLERASEGEGSSVILVTDDVKPDWWMDAGNALLPHPALIEEFNAQIPSAQFWMYHLEGFVKELKYFDVKPEAVSEWSELARLDLSNVYLEVLRQVAVALQTQAMLNNGALTESVPNYSQLFSQLGVDMSRHIQWSNMLGKQLAMSAIQTETLTELLRQQQENRQRAFQVLQNWSTSPVGVQTRRNFKL